MVAVPREAPIRIVLVDDYEPMRVLLRELLVPRGCEVVGEASDGEEAVDLVDRTPCDVVVMDLNMPRMDGAEATRRILAGHPDVEVVAFTSTDEGRDIARLLEAGATAHYQKLDHDGLIDHLLSRP
jgi:DNA-binding NarL/FixJ family response regulator